MHTPSISHTSFPSQCSEHGQHHEQELSKTFPNEEQFPDAPPTPLPSPKVQACLVLAVGSELKDAQHHILKISRVQSSQKQAMVELENNKHSKQRGKVASYSFPTNKNQEHFTPHPHIHHPGIPVQFLGLAVPALLRIQIHIL